MHTTQGVGHTIRSRTCSHVIWVQGTACTTTGSNAEVGFASEHALFLIGTCNRVLEAGRVGGVTGNGNIHILVPQNSYAFANIVCAVAVHFRTRSVRICFTANLFKFSGKVIKLGLHIRETINTADDHSSVFTQTVKDAAERFLTYFVRHFSNFNSAFSSSEGLVASQESEALGLLTEQTSSQVTVA